MNVKHLFVILAVIAALAFCSSSLLGQPVIQQEVSMNGFTFELVGVERTTSGLEAVLLVTAEEQNRWLRIHRSNSRGRHSRYIDDFGVTVIPSRIALGAYHTEGQEVDTVLTEDIRTRIVMRFEVEDTPEGLQLIELYCDVADADDFRVSFKGVRVGD